MAERGRGSAGNDTTPRSIKGGTIRNAKCHLQKSHAAFHGKPHEGDFRIKCFTILCFIALPAASEGWGRYCFHRCLSVHGGYPSLSPRFSLRSLVPGPFQGVSQSQVLSHPSWDWGTHPLETKQQSECLLRGGQYASCGNTG